MEAAISAIVGEIISRIISYVVKKHNDKTTMDEKLERLQQLLLRIHAVVEEADGRYITNSRMLMQLKFLAVDMYRGYQVLDKFRYRYLVKHFEHDESTSSYSSVPLMRSHTVPYTMRSFAETDDLLSVLKNLEGAIANMTEFVVLLGGCEHMCRRPYDTYLYIDSIMFGRHVEKQQVIGTLLRDPEHHGAPTVLPIIGACRVGKKTLVSHVCKNDRIQFYFSSTMFISGDSIQGMEDTNFSNVRTLVLVEFVTDVDDDDWTKFYSTISRMVAKGSKVVIISRIQSLARFGTVKAVFLNSLSHEEYRYLFKMLAFGSTDESFFPRLASVANELAIILGGSLITANVVADLLRRNQDIQFWLRILRRFKGMVDNNLSKYGEHPKDILENERSIDITTLYSSNSAARRLMPPRVERDDSPKRKLAHIQFGDLVAGCVSTPDDEFVLVGWESRIPPYTRYVSDVGCTNKKHGSVTSARKS